MTRAHTPNHADNELDSILSLLFLLARMACYTHSPHNAPASPSHANAGRTKKALPSPALITYLVAPPSANRRAACKPSLADIVVSL